VLRVDRGLVPLWEARGIGRGQARGQRSGGRFRGLISQYTLLQGQQFQLALVHDYQCSPPIYRQLQLQHRIQMGMAHSSTLLDLPHLSDIIPLDLPRPSDTIQLDLKPRPTLILYRRTRIGDLGDRLNLSLQPPQFQVGPRRYLMAGLPRVIGLIMEREWVRSLDSTTAL
jgi:hypothetical protein